MSLEKFLHFLMAHNASIIEVLLGLTLLVILFLSIRIFLVAKEPATAGSGNLDLGNLETTLKQLLDKAGQVPAAAVAGASEDSQRLVTEISNLKSELETKQKQIEELKTSSAANPAGAAAAAGLSSEDKSKLEAQIQELQAKLSEYEIISEDIADLSFYKEQNVKLQKELEALKSGVAPTAPTPVAPASAAPVPPPVQAAPPPAPEPTPVVAPAPPVKPEPEIVGKTQAEAEAEAPAASEPVANTVDDDLMAEFAAAVEKQKTNEATAEPTVAAPVPADPAVDLGQLDMDKMLAEAATIKSDVPDVDPEKALGTSLDENKLLQEAAALESVTQEDKKLMGEFENFVKKSE